MGGALLRGMMHIVAPCNIAVSAKDMAEAEAFAKETGCRPCATNAEAVRGAKVVFIAVKPAFVATVLHEITPALEGDAVVVSMAAGIKIQSVMDALGSWGCSHTLVRIMPNMPAAVGEAMIALSAGGIANEADVALVKTLLERAGKVELVDEKLMDCVTAVSGSGPAFAFMFIEAMADAAVRLGMPRAQAYVYAAQTLKGSAVVALETGKHPAALKDGVCSPAGTTIEGVAALERTGFRNSIIEAVTAAYDRSVALGKK